MGLDDLTSVLSAERTWRTVRTALTGAQVQALRRSVQTFKALGGGWTPPTPKTVRIS
jgi:outer membrane protein TolC